MLTEKPEIILWRRLIIVHIGSDTGFVPDGLLMFESKKTGDYNEDMNAFVFNNWMNSILANPVPYSIDKMVERSGREVLRLPPYHCKLNPIELVWAQVNNYVATNNTTFKLSDVNEIFRVGLTQVTSENWAECIRHTIKEEEQMYRLDNIMEDMEVSFFVNTGSSEDSMDSEDF
jgi:hypothetical protein